VCDGVDNDCNIFSVDNCEVSDACNFDGDNDYSNDPDVCEDNLICGCIIGSNRRCSGDYRCTSMCNASTTGGVGDLCAADEVCGLDLVNSSNVHGCRVEPSTIGVTEAGVACENDAECRSASCARHFVGSGQKTYCADFCASDAYCPADNTVCRLDTITMDAECWPVGRPRVGSTPVGEACSAPFSGDAECDHGLCADDGLETYCTEACCTDSDCPSGYTCSTQGERQSTSYIIPTNAGQSCATDLECPGEQVCFLSQGICAHSFIETIPMCLKDEPAQGARRAGAACTSGSQCASAHCSSVTNTCVEICCSNSTCPLGLTCELQAIETRQGEATTARICVNQVSDLVHERL
jgi:hypothetical protein